VFSSNLKWQANEYGIWWDLNWGVFLSLMLFSQVIQSHLLTNAHPQRKTSKKIWHSEEDGDLTWTNIYRATSNHPKRTWKYTSQNLGYSKTKVCIFLWPFIISAPWVWWSIIESPPHWNGHLLRNNYRILSSTYCGS
jgi:hypothetical protein